ncbi:hypothetical protein COY26_01970 [Candidatus Woesearchaeota archaeon CG_4_10_14_0_2_um_filter_33_10]|nr:MAG: hypothetical protein COV14_04500 [Candidatus Woesearchaeota archaeon CG10_big_fil_rev_8_21_14_0_10_33_12]PIZ53424.1 MAG: hypothetical protein COY26_01970 [Candidatus Woesearchaeota archaeon CG_4_10_14_0_2_um_filter_33_10]
MRIKAQDSKIGRYICSSGNDILYDNNVCFCFVIGLKDRKGNGYLGHIGTDKGAITKLTKQLEEFFSIPRNNIEAIIGGPKNPGFKKDWKIIKKELKKYTRNIHEEVYDNTDPKTIELPLKTFKLEISYK